MLLGIGVWAERRNRDAKDFFLGGRRLGAVVAAISASASSSSAWTLLAVSGLAYRTGLSALWVFPACVGGFALNWFVLAPSLRRHAAAKDEVTVTDVLAGQGAARSRRVAALAAVIVLVSLGVYVASQYQAAGKTLAETFDLSREGSIAIGAGVVLVYTLLGGFWAVSVTDTLQGLVMAATALVVPVAALVAVGGFGGLAERLAAVEAPGYLRLGGPSSGVAALGLVLGYFGIGLGYPGQPHVVNRFMALRDEAALRRGQRVAIAWAVVVYAGMLLLGLCARALYPGVGDSEVVLVTATNDLFPPVVVGVMLAAVLSAIMSTADSQLLVAASAVTHDLRLGGPTDRSRLRRARATVLALGLAAIAAALWLDESIFATVLFGWYAMGAAFGPLLLVIVVGGRRLGAGAVLGVMATGFALSLLGHALAPAGPWSLVLKGVVPFLAALALASVLGRRPDPRSA